MQNERVVCAPTLGRWALVLSFALAGPGTAAADVVATGDVAVVSNYGDLSGSTITWDNASYNVFGAWDVNLGAEPGINVMEVPLGGGTVGPNAGTPPHGNFVVNYFSAGSPWNGVLQFGAGGDFVCPDSVGICGSERASLSDPWYPSYGSSQVSVSGTFVNGGPGTLPTVLGGVPITYSIDGALRCLEIAPYTNVCDGLGNRVNLNAFKAVNTAPGGAAGDPNDTVDVPFLPVYTNPDNGQQIPLSLTVSYDAVLSTGFTNVVTSSQAGGDIDPNFFVEVPGFPDIFLDITTTAVITGPITVCGYYSDGDQDGLVDGTLANECDLRVLHNDAALPDVFIDSTLADDDPFCPFDQQNTTCGNNLCIDTVTNQLCAGVTSLSPFKVAIRNEVPVASAGGDQAVVQIGTEVGLNGGQSYDPEGYAISYAWSFASKPVASGAVLNGTNVAMPTFTPDVYGDYVVELVVTDALGRSSTPDTSLVSFANVPPVADAGDNQAVRVGDIVLLDGSGSDDANGNSLAYQWSLVSAPAGSVAALDDPTLETPTFAPDVPGAYEIDLIVSDGLLGSSADGVTIVATTAEGELVDTLEYAIDIVNGLDPAVFKNKSLRKNMAKHIGQALGLADEGDYEGAREKLEAVLRKTDGCASGAQSDRNDWIQDCGAQGQIHPVLVYAIALVDEILGS